MLPFQTAVPAAEVWGRAGRAPGQLRQRALHPPGGPGLEANVQFSRGHLRLDHLYLLLCLRCCPGREFQTGFCDGVDCVGDTLWTFLSERWTDRPAFLSSLPLSGWSLSVTVWWSSNFGLGISVGRCQRQCDGQVTWTRFLRLVAVNDSVMVKWLGLGFSVWSLSGMVWWSSGLYSSFSLVALSNSVTIRAIWDFSIAGIGSVAVS